MCKKFLGYIFCFLFHIYFNNIQEDDIELLKKEIAHFNELLQLNATNTDKLSDHLQVLNVNVCENFSDEIEKLQQENAKLKHRVNILLRVSF